MAFVQRRAWFFNSKGEYHGKKNFSKNTKIIEYANGAYNVDYQNSSVKEDTVFPLILKRRTYFYNLENSNPLTIDKKVESPISPEAYNIQLKTKVLRDLNDLAKGDWLSKLLTPKTLLIIGGAIILYWLWSSGNLNFGGTPTPTP